MAILSAKQIRLLNKYQSNLQKVGLAGLIESCIQGSTYVNSDVVGTWHFEDVWEEGFEADLTFNADGTIDEGWGSWVLEGDRILMTGDDLPIMIATLVTFSGDVYMEAPLLTPVGEKV